LAVVAPEELAILHQEAQPVRLQSPDQIVSLIQPRLMAVGAERCIGTLSLRPLVDPVVPVEAAAPVLLVFCQPAVLRHRAIVAALLDTDLLAAVIPHQAAAQITPVAAVVVRVRLAAVLTQPARAATVVMVDLLQFPALLLHTRAVAAAAVDFLLQVVPVVPAAAVQVQQVRLE
jgi:hypothetical protein